MAEARELYLRDCAPCHGETGRGDGPECAALRLPPADLTRLTAAHGGTLPREYFVDVVTGKIDVPAHGTCEMPVWRRRFGPSDSGPAAVAAIHTERRLDLLAAYVRSLQRPAPGRR
jgi:mono/diheme cytochrome c family protein